MVKMVNLKTKLNKKLNIVQTEKLPFMAEAFLLLLIVSLMFNNHKPGLITI